LIDSFNKIRRLLFIKQFLQSRVYGKGECLIDHQNRVRHNDVCASLLVLQVFAGFIDVILEYQTLKVMGLSEE